MEDIFKLKENNTSVKTEIIAGFTTFFTMSYIIFVNPSMLAEAGMDSGSVMVATCLAAALGTLLMGIMSNYPFAQAPGMGMNAFFVYTICISLGWKWEGALAAVFVAGVIFFLITLSGLRESILNSIPRSMKYAISAGIGFFIASVGLKNGFIISLSESGLFIGSFSNPHMILCIIGLVITLLLMSFKVKGGILIGIVLTTIVGTFIPDGDGDTITSFQGIQLTPSVIFGFGAFILLILFVILWGITRKKFFAYASAISVILSFIMLIINIFVTHTSLSMAPTFLKLDFSAMFVGPNLFVQITTLLTVILALLIVDIFDTMGTIIGTAEKAGYLDKEGKLPRAKNAFMADAIASMASALFGTSTVTTFVESVSGVNEGGRTGLTSVCVSGLFVLSLLFAPVAGIVPGVATAPALIVVGILMMKPLSKINWDDFSEVASSFMIILVMPFTTSITDGLAFGFVTYVICKAATKKSKDINPIIWGVTILFIIYYSVKAMVIG